MWVTAPQYWPFEKQLHFRATGVAVRQYVCIDLAAAFSLQNKKKLKDAPAT